MDAVWYLVIIAIVLLIVPSVLFLVTTEEEINIVDCYDRYGNEILGMSCEEKELYVMLKDNPKITEEHFIVYPLVIFGLFIISLILLGFIENKKFGRERL